MKLFKKVATCAGIVAFWLAIWYIGALAINNPLIVPSPLETFKRLCELILTKDFRFFTALSLLRIIIGIVIAIPAAFIMAAACSYSKIASKLLEPAVLLMKSTPVVSFILIAIFIFNREIIPSAITFIMIFPVLYRNICEGISQTPKDLLEMAYVFRVSWILKVRNIYVPSIMPYFCSALTTSVGLAIKAGIAAEVVAYIPNSIGKKLSDAKSYMEPADLLAWTAVIIILSLLIEKVIGALLSALGRRKRNA
ncbi:MAG: ABC transporter permease subunit [Clostridia bacterium]|nr:ABC transporter permease subunit [Clostridia bacterium]